MNKFQIISPVDNSVYAERAYASTNQIEEVLQKASNAKRAWKNTPIEERKAFCLTAVDYFQQNIQAISDELTWTMGRPIRYTPLEISGGFKERALYMIEIAARSLKDLVAEDSPEFKKLIRKEPLGTVLVLSPWNYPYLTSVNAVFPALLAGNTVILKHADQTAQCAERYLDAFNAAGLPPGIFQYLHLTHGQVAEVISDERVNHVSFTGSVSGGLAIQKAANQRFINTGLELGGKDAAYVRPDADLKLTVENLVDGSYFNSGQSCCGIERIYVHQDVYDDFIDKFMGLTLQYVIGNPTDPKVTLGPMVRPAAAKKVMAHIENALSKGARALIDRGAFPADLPLPYLAPQILAEADHTMLIMKEETFGPVAGIMKVASDEEAVKLINDSQYGLTASIWTTDSEKALEVGRQVESGTFYMNRCDYLDPALAWTGVKNSGRGCTLSAMGFDQFTRPKSYHLKLK